MMGVALFYRPERLTLLEAFCLPYPSMSQVFIKAQFTFQNKPVTFLATHMKAKPAFVAERLKQAEHLIKILED